MKQIVTIESIRPLTHDVLQIRTAKPDDIHFEPGQAADISIHQPAWEQELRPFTFTSLPSESALEFTIKTYPSHNGVTNQLRTLKVGDELMVHEVFGDIAYKGEGLFIAGGAGITPFIAIFKQLEKENRIGSNKLIFANKTRGDIILEDKFRTLLGPNFMNVLSGEESVGYEHGHVSAALIEKHRKDATSYVYLCGPDPMMEAVGQQLQELKVPEDRIVREGF